MKVTLDMYGKATDGGTPLIQHGERLADPLDPFTRAIREISKKRKKTDAEHEEIGRLEWHGGLYTDPPIPDPASVDGQVIVLPAWNIIRCLQDGATRHKRGKDVLRGVHPITQTAPLDFDGSGPSLTDLWRGGGHFIRKTVGVQRQRTMRTRGLFSEWEAHLDIEVDLVIFDVDELAVMWREAGTYVGLGDMRPIYGRFRGTITLENGTVLP